MLLNALWNLLLQVLDSGSFQQKLMNISLIPTEAVLLPTDISNSAEFLIWTWILNIIENLRVNEGRCYIKERSTNTISA